MLNSFFLQTVNNLVDIIVNDCKDTFKHIPGPDVGIATIDHEDIENGNKESEMIKTAMNDESADNWKRTVEIEWLVFTNQKGNSVPSSQTIVVFTYEQVWSLQVYLWPFEKRVRTLDILVNH